MLIQKEDVYIHESLWHHVHTSPNICMWTMIYYWDEIAFRKHDPSTDPRGLMWCSRTRLFEAWINPQWTTESGHGWLSPVMLPTTAESGREWLSHIRGPQCGWRLCELSTATYLAIDLKYSCIACDHITLHVSLPCMQAHEDIYIKPFHGYKQHILLEELYIHSFWLTPASYIIKHLMVLHSSHKRGEQSRLMQE